MRIPPFGAWMFAAVLATTCVGCSDNGTYSSPDADASAAVTDLPHGLIESAADRGKPVVGGVYRDASNTCCWTAPVVHAVVEKVASDNRLDLRIYLPDAATFRATPQGISARVGGGPPFSACCFGPGVHDVIMPLPALSRGASGRVMVDLTMRVTFVPKADGCPAVGQRSRTAM